MASSAPEVSNDALSAPLEAGAPTPAPPAEAPKRKTTKRKSAGDMPISKEEPGEELHPLPEGASGFRKRAKKEGHVPVRSSSIPGMTVGDVRKSLNQIRKAGTAIQSNHLIWNGWTAGRFCIAYVLGNHNKRAKTSEDEAEDAEEPEEEAPEA